MDLQLKKFVIRIKSSGYNPDSVTVLFCLEQLMGYFL